MSNIYIKEPSTNGKVLLHTSLGDIDIELWPKEAPLACRNFVQLCMEGYYDGLIFHRVVPGFIVQGGDPTGSGTGGESVYGEPFKDEIHQRLRFVRRGLVAMANAGPNDNASQFFFTLGPCNDLNKKHTIFGKVTGDTVYNMIRLGEVDVDAEERPLNPPSIRWAKVLASPFDDIEPRTEPERNKKKQEVKKAKSQSRATKDYKLLSFGDEAENDEEEYVELSFKGSKSSHDLAKDPHLSAAPAISMTDERESTKRERESEDEQSSASDDDSVSSSEQEKGERAKKIRDKLTMKKAKLENDAESGKTSKLDTESDKIKEMRKESRKIARELANKKTDNNKQESSSSGSENDELSSGNAMFAEYKAQQKLYRNKISGTKQKGSSREQQTLALLGNFRTKILAVRKDAGWDEDDNEYNVVDDKEPVKTEGKNDEDSDDNVGWMMHRFKNSDGELHNAKDMNKDVNEDRYEITDPRNPLNQRRRDKDKDKKESRHHSHKNDRRDSSRSSNHGHHRR